MTDEGYKDRGEARANAIIRLAWESLPTSVETNREHDDWNVYVPATVARCAYLLESILALGERYMDSGIILRSLFEHVVTFAWVSADHRERLPRLIGNDYEQRLKFFRYFSAHGREPHDAGAEQRLQERVTAIRRGLPAPSKAQRKAGTTKPRLLPSLETMALDADAYWRRVLPDLGLEGVYTLSGQYVGFYRSYSQHVHPTIFGLQPLVFEQGDRHVIFGRPEPSELSPASSGSVIFSQLLLLAAYLCGWPEPGRVAQIHEQFPV